jgi:DNA-binding transcriptional LysR family regulator
MHFSVATLLFLSPVKFQDDAPRFPILIVVTVESNRVVVKFPTANCVFTSLALIVSWAAAGVGIAAVPHMIAMPAISRFMSPP